MKRTNIYLDEQELKLLRHLAVEEGHTTSELIRRAVRTFLMGYLSEGPGKSVRVQDPLQRIPQAQWQKRWEKLLADLRARTAGIPSDEIEAEITKAQEEVRAARRQRRQAK